MNPKRILSLLLIIALTICLLSSCNRNEPEIIVGDINISPISNEAEYQSPGYYAPNTMLSADSPVVPAPASDAEINAAISAINAPIDADYERASIFTHIAKGDMSVAVVMDETQLISPLRCTSLDMMNLTTLAFEGLVALDSSMKPVPQLADRWDKSGNSWTFTLRQNVMFHDGTLLTPEDVVASYQDLMMNSGSYWYPMMTLIKDMKVISDTSIMVQSASSGYMLLYAMTFPIVQRNSLASSIPLGTGPYRVSDFDPGNAVRLERNELWWRRGNFNVSSIVGQFYSDNKRAINAMERGEADTIATEYPTASIGRNLSDRVTKDYPTLTYECIVPNLKSPILRDHAVREALMYAIDRSTLANTVYTGMAQESEVPVVPGSWLYEPQAAIYNYNPERALYMLNEAGWLNLDGSGVLSKVIDGKNTELRLTLVTSDRGTTSTRSEACEAIATQLQSVGIAVTWQRYDKLTALKETMSSGKFDLALCAFELNDVPNLFFLLHSSGDSNYMKYNSAEMDQLLKAAYNAPTEDELSSAMSKLQLKVVSDLPILGLFFRNGVVSSRVTLSGIDAPRRGFTFEGIAMG